MKILLGVPEYPPFNVGGGGEVFKNLAENYKKLGHDVVVLYGYYPTKSWWEDIIEYTDEKGIKFYRIPEIPYPKPLPYLRTAMPPNLNVLLKLKRIIQKEKPDIAHLHGYGLIFINILSNILYNLEIKYIFTIHGYPETPNSKGLMIKIIYNLYLISCMGPTLKNSFKITGVSDYISFDKKIEKYNGKIITILNGINQDEYTEDKGSQNFDIYTKLNLSKDKDITIFSMGRLSKMKGFHLIIEKMKFFIDKGINIHYIITGVDDGYLIDLNKLIDNYKLNNNVHFLGWVDKKDLISLLYRCDMFAIPSLWDPCPIAAFEGMACNKFIITTEAGGIKEILKDYPYKININVKNFFEKMLFIILKKEYQNHKKIDLSPMSWENVSKKYIKCMIS